MLDMLWNSDKKESEWYGAAAGRCKQTSRDLDVGNEIFRWYYDYLVFIFHELLIVYNFFSVRSREKGRISKSRWEEITRACLVCSSSEFLICIYILPRVTFVII